MFTVLDQQQRFASQCHKVKQAVLNPLDLILKKTLYVTRAQGLGEICTTFILCIALLLSTKSLAQTKSETLNLCVDPDWMPFEAVIDKQHTGIASDYAVLFSQLTSYSFNRIPTQSWQETLEFLQSDKCDLTLMLNSSIEREKFLTFTIPYFFGPNVLVSKADIPFMQDVDSVGDMTLGIVSGYRLLEEIPKYYQNVNIKVVESEEAGLLAVENGLIDVFVGSLYSISLSLQQLKLKSLRVNGWISIQDKLRIGFTKKNEDLVSVFNQAIDAISTEQHNTILNRWSNVHIVKQTDYTLLYMILTLSTLVFLVFLWRYMLSLNVLRALSSKNAELDEARQELILVNKNLEYLSFHDNLTSLYNRHYFLSAVQNHLTHMQRQKGESGLLMIDLDYFKSINDEYGHGVGDKILKQFADTLLKALRASDIAARWGGEEFIVLLPLSNKIDSLTLAQRVLEVIKEHTFELDIAVTISIGVGQLRQDDTVESWIERADSAVYIAKREGRNRIEAID